MSKKANPVAIGSFVIGAIVLIIVGVMVFSSGRLFTTTHTLVAIFPETVKGLKVGNPVEFRGVRVGSVKDIKIMYDAKTRSIAVPVYMEIQSGVMIDADLKQMKPVRSGKKWAADMSSLIDKGLRAQLDLQSVVTGQLVVTLDFFPGTPAKMVRLDKRYVEIPTMPSTMSRMMGMLQKLPLDQLAQKAISVLDGIDSLARSPELKNTLQSASMAALDARKLLEGISVKVQPLADSAQTTIIELRKAIGNIEQQLGRTLEQISALTRNVDRQVDPLARSATGALKEARSAFKSVDGLIGKDSVTRADLENTLQELAGAARSLRILADYLEQHPDALIKGKGY
jgi:paraquat-inducible protein B